MCLCFKKRAARRGSPLKGRPVGPRCHPASLRSVDSLRGGGDELAREPGFLASGGRRVRQVGGPGPTRPGPVLVEFLLSLKAVARIVRRAQKGCLSGM